MFDDWGGVINSGPVSRGPIGYGGSVQVATKHAKVPVKVSVGAGPAISRGMSTSTTTRTAKGLSFALAPIFNAEMKDLVAAGAKYLQFEDLGAWLPLFTGDKAYYTWIKDVVAQCCDGVDAKIGWHFCFGNAWGNDLSERRVPRGLSDGAAALLRYTGHHQFVLDYANRDMAGVEFLANLPKDKDGPGRRARHPVQCHRDAAAIVARIKKVVAAVSPDRVMLSTDCGMKPLARMVAKMKLKALAEGAKLVRAEVAGVR